MKNPNSMVKEKAFQQVSFPRSFVSEVTAAADAAGRSPAKHFEHCVRIAQAVEEILPSSTVQALKMGSLPASELLLGLAAVLSNVGQSTAIQRIKNTNPLRISLDLDDPNVAIRTHADGSRERGSLDERGQFVPDSTSRTNSTRRATNASVAPKAERQSTSKTPARKATLRRSTKVLADA